MTKVGAKIKDWIGKRKKVHVKLSFTERMRIAADIKTKKKACESVEKRQTKPIQKLNTK